MEDLVSNRCSCGNQATNHFVVAIGKNIGAAAEFGFKNPVKISRMKDRQYTSTSLNRLHVSCQGQCGIENKSRSGISGRCQRLTSMAKPENMYRILLIELMGKNCLLKEGSLPEITVPQKIGGVKCVLDRL